MKDEKEKLEIKKKPQDVKKEDLDKVGGGGDGDLLCIGTTIKAAGCGYSDEFCK